LANPIDVDEFLKLGTPEEKKKFVGGDKFLPSARDKAISATYFTAITNDLWARATIKVADITHLATAENWSGSDYWTAINKVANDASAGLAEVDPNSVLALNKQLTKGNATRYLSFLNKKLTAKNEEEQGRVVHAVNIKIDDIKEKILAVPTVDADGIIINEKDYFKQLKKLKEQEENEIRTSLAGVGIRWQGQNTKMGEFDTAWFNAIQDRVVGWINEDKADVDIIKERQAIVIEGPEGENFGTLPLDIQYLLKSEDDYVLKKSELRDIFTESRNVPDTIIAAFLRNKQFTDTKLEVADEKEYNKIIGMINDPTIDFSWAMAGEYTKKFKGPNKKQLLKDISEALEEVKRGKGYPDDRVVAFETEIQSGILTGEITSVTQPLTLESDGEILWKGKMHKTEKMSMLDRKRFNMISQDFFDTNRPQMVTLVDKKTALINKEFETWWDATNMKAKIAGSELMFDMATSTTLTRVQNVKQKLLNSLKNNMNFYPKRELHTYFIDGNPNYIMQFLSNEDYGTSEQMMGEWGDDLSPDSGSPETALPDKIDPTEPKMPVRKPDATPSDYYDSPEYIKWKDEHNKWRTKKNKQ